MNLSFTKLVGTGNDFVLIDRRRRGSLSKAEGTRMARELCDRKRGIGADGILVLESSKKADFRMRIFNPDGSEAEMCGNGSRCAALYVVGKSRGRVSFETLAGRLEATVRGNVVRVKLPNPFGFRKNLSLTLDGRKRTLHTITATVPHAILFADDLKKVDVERLGEAIRNDRLFKPRGTNVDFVKVLGRGKIEIRTYERGVEGETLACGTGAVASALVTSKLRRFSSPITVLTKGRERLKIFFEERQGNFENVSLEGRVSRIFEGRVNHV